MRRRGAKRTAQQLGIDRTVMTHLLDDLERADLGERRPAPADRRPAHRRHGHRPRTPRRPRHPAPPRGSSRPGRPTPADQQTFKSLLQRLAGYANDLDPVSDACAIVPDINAATSS